APGRPADARSRPLLRAKVPAGAGGRAPLLDGGRLEETGARQAEPAGIDDEGRDLRRSAVPGRLPGVAPPGGAPGRIDHPRHPGATGNDAPRAGIGGSDLLRRRPGEAVRAASRAPSEVPRMVDGGEAEERGLDGRVLPEADAGMAGAEAARASEPRRLRRLP